MECVWVWLVCVRPTERGRGKGAWKTPTKYSHKNGRERKLFCKFIHHRHTAMQCIACPSITFFRYHAYCCAQIMGWKKMKMKTEDWWVEKVCWTSLLGLPLVLATDTLCDVHVGYYTSVHLRNGILMRSCALMSNHTDAKWRWIADRENDIMQYYTRITETTEFVQKQTKRNRIIQSNNIIFFIHFFPKLKCINQHDFYLTERKRRTNSRSTVTKARLNKK